MATTHTLPQRPVHTTRRSPPGVATLTLLAVLTTLLVLSTAALASPQPLGVLRFVAGSFGADSRADFASTPAARFAPQRPLTTTGQPAT